MRTPDDITLMAYADGELDAEAAADVEAACFADPSVQSRLDAMLRTAAMVRAAYDAPTHAQVPDHLVAAVMAYAADSTSASDRKVVPLLPRGVKRILHAKHTWAAAAAVALFVGFGVSQGWEAYRRTNSPVAELQAGEAVLRQAVNQALETLPNGQMAPLIMSDRLSGSVTPLRTYVNGEGLYCREYQLAIDDSKLTEERTGVACRHGTGDWRQPDVLGTVVGHS